MRTISHHCLRPATLFALALAALAAGCEKNSPPPSDPAPGDDGGQVVTRRAAVPATHPLFDRFEGTGFGNDCSADSECRTAGCSSEVCSADPGVVTTCEVLPVSLPASTSCGCVESQCQWWNAEGVTLPPVPTPSEPPPAEVSCATVLCQPPRTCLEYYGIAGPSGPKFASCEVACDPTSKKNSCPEGTSCVTIADGPGNVCR
jgi:eight-cysteine-cluster-containing protein